MVKSHNKFKGPVNTKEHLTSLIEKCKFKQEAIFCASNWQKLKRKLWGNEWPVSNKTSKYFSDWFEKRNFSDLTLIKSFSNDNAIVFISVI